MPPLHTVGLKKTTFMLLTALKIFDFQKTVKKQFLGPTESYWQSVLRIMQNTDECGLKATAVASRC